MAGKPAEFAEFEREIAREHVHARLCLGPKSGPTPRWAVEVVAESRCGALIQGRAVHSLRDRAALSLAAARTGFRAAPNGREPSAFGQSTDINEALRDDLWSELEPLKNKGFDASSRSLSLTVEAERTGRGLNFLSPG